MITESASDQKVLDKSEPGAVHTNNVDNCGIKIMEVRKISVGSWITTDSETGSL
jgi:hypothetical protein